MTINCKGKLIDFSTPKVMGILNLTPDSFYDGGKYKNQDEILLRTEKMLNEGANFIDVGGYSSKPNANFVTEEEELKRVIPIVKLLVATFPDILISVDSFRAKVAQESIAAGAAIINDISAGNLDDKMIPTIGNLQVPYLMMHMRGTPQTMQTKTTYNNLIQEINYYFSQKIQEAYNAGINDIIIDPGFGFAKTTEQNFELFKQLDIFKHFQLPILVGISRKSMLYKTLETTPDKALNATSVLNTYALLNGANILRVHDVKEAVECVKLTQKLMF